MRASRWLPLSLSLAACTAFGAAQTTSTSDAPGDAGADAGAADDAPPAAPDSGSRVIQPSPADGGADAPVDIVCALPATGSFDDFEGATPADGTWSPDVAPPSTLIIDTKQKYCGAQSVLVTLGPNGNGHAVLSRTLTAPSAHVHWSFLLYVQALTPDSNVFFATLSTAAGTRYAFQLIGTKLDLINTTSDQIDHKTVIMPVFPVSTWTLLDVDLDTSLPKITIKAGDPHHPMAMTYAPTLQGDLIVKESLGVFADQTPPFSANFDREELTVE